MPYPLTSRWLMLAAAAATTTFTLTACGGDDDPAPTEETRAQDSRVFTVKPADATATTFAAVTGGDADAAASLRWAGVLGGSSYQIEVPKTWNGKLVMYAHGYAGTGTVVGVQTLGDGLRRHLLGLGYAWAASSYSKNFYDVRAGIEDTNALALEFPKIAAAKGLATPTPTKTFIIGHSMGGHIAAAAVEDETFATANHKVKYQGAVPMCGVTGDTELFDYLGAAQIAAHGLAGAASTPTTGWEGIKGAVGAKLFTAAALTPAGQYVFTADGEKWAAVMQNLTGGARPMFDLGVKGYYTTVVWSTFGGDGTVNGIYNRFGADTNRFTYRIDNDPVTSATLNAGAQKLTAAAEYNRKRSDGLRWVPKVNGEFKVPVVTIHTLGDMYVPFSMEQIYRNRAEAKGNGGWLVQRAIRGIAHCDFSAAEQTEAFDAMVAWEAGGPRPAGDDVLTPTTVANPSYGCTFTRDAATANGDSADLVTLRNGLKVAKPCV